MRTLILLLFAITYAFAGNPANIKSIIEKSGKEPVQYVVEKFKQSDYVVFNEIHKLKHETDFIKTLIPVLNKAGIHTLATDFGNSEDQANMNKLLESPSFDRNLAIQIMQNSRRDGILGYQEILDIYKAAWEINQISPEKFKIVLLGNIKSPVNINVKAMIVSNNLEAGKVNLNSDKICTVKFYTAAHKDFDEAYTLLSSRNPVAIDIPENITDIKCDGYIYLKSRNEFEPMTWIDDFINDDYLCKVKEQFKYLQIDTKEYATDLCKAQNWINFELSRGSKIN